MVCYDIKYFCIGLHKTGTTTLHHRASKHGLKSQHSIRWNIDSHDFFCDGGSHFNDINEIDYEYLYKKYPNSKFIINIRDVRSWIISKLKHAGWNEKTVVTPDQDLICHHNWKDKTKKNIALFIIHYFDRYIKILKFFLDKKDRGFVVDVVSNRIDNLNLIFQDNIDILDNIHKNKRNGTLSIEILEFIDNEINNVNKDKYELLESLLKQYNY